MRQFATNEGYFTAPTNTIGRDFVRSASSSNERRLAQANRLTRSKRSKRLIAATALLLTMAGGIGAYNTLQQDNQSSDPAYNPDNLLMGQAYVQIASADTLPTELPNMQISEVVAKELTHEPRTTDAAVTDTGLEKSTYITASPAKAINKLINNSWEEIQPVAYAEIELPASTIKKIDSHMVNINKLKPLYIEAAQEVSLPWQAAAALHYREADNLPERSALSGELLGTINPDSKTKAPVNKLDNYKQALKHLKSMAKLVYGIDLNNNSTLEEWKKAFLANNRGFMYKNATKVTGEEWGPEKSPYVMSGIKDYVKMRWPNRGLYEGKATDWGETIHGEIETRPGAIAIMNGLGYQFNK